jgi:hypothetical protein
VSFPVPHGKKEGPLRGREKGGNRGSGAQRKGDEKSKRAVTDHLHDIHIYAREHLKLASDRMKTRYDKLANSTGFHEDDRVWLYRPTRKKGKSPKLQPSCEDPYKVINRINNDVYRIQKNPRRCW